MQKVTLSTIKKLKKQHCNGVSGSYQKMRSACKNYVDEKGASAKRGKKGITKLKARNAALKIINAPCKK